MTIIEFGEWMWCDIVVVDVCYPLCVGGNLPFADDHDWLNGILSTNEISHSIVRTIGTSARKTIIILCRISCSLVNCTDDNRAYAPIVIRARKILEKILL